MILGLRTAIYPAPALEQAKGWYSRVLPMAQREGLNRANQ